MAKGFDAGRLDGVMAGTEDAELRLLRSTQLLGVVVAEPDGKPVSSFEVRLEKRAWLVIERPVVVGDDLEQCPYCTYLFFNITNAPLKVCPRCKSYISGEDAL